MALPPVDSVVTVLWGNIIRGNRDIKFIVIAICSSHIPFTDKISRWYLNHFICFTASLIIHLSIYHELVILIWI